MFLTRQEAARYLGVSVRTLDGWKANGRLAYYDLGEVKGRIIRFRTEDLDALASYRPAGPRKRRWPWKR